MNNQIEILLATYNGEKFVADQIRSILEQTHKNIRLIIRDDGSTDGTRAILEFFSRQYPEKILLLPQEKNLGIRGNFSKLMEHAQTNYVMLADQDDLWLPEKVAKTLEKMKKAEAEHGPRCPLLVHTDLIVTDKNLNTLHQSFWNLSRLRPAQCRSLGQMLVQNNVTGCTMMMNRALLETALPIPAECIMHDWWLALVAAAFGHIYCVSESTMLYRQHGNNAIGACLQHKSLWRKIMEKKILSKRRRSPTLHELDKCKQANAFLQRFEKKLSPHQKALLDSYLKLRERKRIKNSYLILKYGFFTNDPIKNALRIVCACGL